MAIEPIASVDGVTAVPAFEASLLEYLHQVNASPAQIALAEAKAKEGETIEQRAAGGDPGAALELAKEEERAIPIDSQQLLPPHSDHLEPHASQHLPGDHGVHEEGKGDVVDIYD